MSNVDKDEGVAGDAGERVTDRLASLRNSLILQQVLAVLLIVSIVVVTHFGLNYVNFRVELILQRFGGEFPDKLFEDGFLEFIAGFSPPDFYAMTLHTKNNGIHGLEALWASLTHPSWIVESIFTDSQRITLVRASLVTLLLGFLGTVLGFLPALLLGVLGSERVTPFPFNFIFRGIMSGIRAIPAIVWIFLFVPFGPPSQATAVLAIGVDTIGNLGRLFTDELEEIEEGPIEAIRSTGASGSQTVIFGMLSQVSRSFIAWTLYILEINTRIAISLGVVGAGGLGFYIKNMQNLANFSESAAGIVMVFVVVLSIEMLSSRIRSRLRPGEHGGGGLLERLQGLFDPRKWLGTDVEKP